MMNKLILAIALTAAVPAQAQGFFKKAVPAESPAAEASKPQPSTAAPAPAPKPAPAPAAAPVKAAEPEVKPKPAPKPQQRPVKPVQRPAVAEPAPAPAERAAAHQPPPQTAPAAASQNAAAKGMVDPVGECAGGWGIAQAFCRSVQCQKAESFHHPVCIDMRAEQAARQQNQMGGGG